MADHLYVRYQVVEAPELSLSFRFAEVIWIEWKCIRAGRKASTKATQHQNAWHQAERARGALTLIAGVDFPATIEGFTEWYKASGLMRKQINIR